MTLNEDSEFFSHTLRRCGTWTGEAARCHLDYEGRFLRRKRLVTDDGMPFLVNLDKIISVHEGDAFEISGGGLIEIRAASEPLYHITGNRLAALAWHIGNRHTPCAVAQDHLLIRRDEVLAKMLAGLGAQLTEIYAPFNPEGGAYGFGRTHSHSHAESDHAG
ncbi:MAG: urease accessory protein UreE [Pseudomonadota bacterium]